MTVDGDRSVRFQQTGGGGGGSAGGGRSKRLPGRMRGAYQSQPSLNRPLGALRVTPSMYRLDHLNPQQRASLGKSYMHLAKSRSSLKNRKKNKQKPMAPQPPKDPKGSVIIGMEKPDRPHRNRHIASAHRLIQDSGDDDEPSFKQRLSALMNTYNWQIAMVVLIILDCVMVLGEMVIELRLFQGENCDAEDKVQHSMKPEAGHGDSHAVTTTLASVLLNVTMAAAGEAGHHGGHSDCEHLQHTMHEVEHAFHWTSICILFLFNVELVLRLYAQGYKYFLHLEIALDAMIVMVSFGLDIAFLDSKMKKYLYLLIILRVWRVLRVVHAIITAIRAPHERQIEKLKKKKKMLQRDLAKAYFYSNMLEEEIRNLRNYIDSFEIVEDYDEEEDYEDEYSDYEQQRTIDRNNNQQQKTSSKKSLTFQQQQPEPEPEQQNQEENSEQQK